MTSIDIPRVKKSRKLGNEVDNLTGYIFIAPWLIGFFVFALGPIIASMYFSFTDYDLLSVPQWAGFTNFTKMFTDDERFWHAVNATIYYVFVSVPLRLAFALLVAMLFNVKRKAIGFYRTLYYIPSIMGGSVAIAIMWKQIFSGNGVLNSLLILLGIQSKISWVATPGTAIWTLILLAVWQFGSSMLIFLAGLKQIPDSCYEAAVIDGANSWRKFTGITLPLLTPVILFNLVMQIINGFMVFTQGVIITDGGRPLDTTLFYAVYLYQKAFTTFQMGYGSAMAWVLLIVIAVFTALIFKSSSAWVYYESKGDM